MIEEFNLRSQPTRQYVSNDNIYTPDALALACVGALAPSGVVLEPCEGDGAFRRALLPLAEVITLEASREDLAEQFGFFSRRIDWVITNPPWSQFRVFLSHSMELADHVAFLATVNHWWTKRRVQDVADAGFGYRQLCLCDWPLEWPASGFALGLMHIQRGYRGPLDIARLDVHV